MIPEGQRKPNKIRVNQSSEFSNNSFKDFLKTNNIEMYSTYNEGKSVVAEKSIRTLKNKIFKHMTAISKNVYFDVLDDIVGKYNNPVHRTTKMKPLTLRVILMLNTMKILIKKTLNLKLVTMLEFQNTTIFLLKDTLQIGRKRFLLLVKLKIQFRGLM